MKLQNDFLMLGYQKLIYCNGNHVYTEVMEQKFILRFKGIVQ